MEGTVAIDPRVQSFKVPVTNSNYYSTLKVSDLDLSSLKIDLAAGTVCSGPSYITSF